MNLSEEALPVICNPITGQYTILPEHTSYRKSYSFLGFDPMEKQYKVLSMDYPPTHDDDSDDDDDHHRILTIGTGEMMWRKIHCSLTPEPLSEGMCINGVLYYLAQISLEYVIVCFDVRSEEFKFIDANCFRDLSISKLINYTGKLGGISLKYANINMFVLEDIEKQEWLKHVYTLPKNKIFDASNVFDAGMTATGEIVLSEYYRSRKVSSYVFYFNLEKNTFETVEIQGFGESEKCGTVYPFVDHVEYLSATDAKLLKSSIYAQSVKNNYEADNPP